jgi:probable F420-dependent oxidoreductase
MSTDRFAVERPELDLGAVGLWHGPVDAHPSAAVIEATQELESIGFRSLWLAEAVGRDPMVQAANILGHTKTLKIATGIANIYARDPMTMNAGQRTLAEAYPGRFLLGLGVSHGHLVAGIRKHDYSKPYSYMVEVLEKMDKALFMAVGPATRPARVLAALGPKMLQLSATQAEGAHPYFTTPDHTKLARDVMGPAALLAPEQMVCFETDPVKARETARLRMKIYLGLPNYANNLLRLGFTEDDIANGASDRLVDAIVAWGTADQIVARIREHHAAGADHVCVQVLRSDNALPLGEWRELAGALGLAS